MKLPNSLQPSFPGTNMPEGGSKALLHCSCVKNKKNKNAINRGKSISADSTKKMICTEVQKFFLSVGHNNNKKTSLKMLASFYSMKMFCLGVFFCCLCGLRLKFSNFVICPSLHRLKDTLGGRFDATQSFVGELADVQMWSSVLSGADIEGLASCRNHLTGDVLSWSDADVELHGGVLRRPFQACH